MIRKSMLTASTLTALAVLSAAGTWAIRTWACPFCSAVALTLSEEIDNSQIAAIGKLVQLPPPPVEDAPGASLDVLPARFEITHVLKGAESVGVSKTVSAIYFGNAPIGSTFLLLGIDPPEINWGTPIALGERGQEYVEKAMLLPKDGAERLAYFQEFLEDRDETLSRDAYDEFAKMSYANVQALKPHMHHDKLVEWIKDPQIPSSRRRLYLTMLGVCGNAQDATMLEQMIQSKDRQARAALDALVACYLTLKGPQGMPLVEDLFLKNKEAEYTDTYATIIALRFHGTEENIIPREKLLGGLRHMLDRPQLADLIIPDLARWEDWSAMPRLVELFKNADEESNWVRVPVITYLRACPLPEAKAHIAELAKVDPEAVKRAETFYPFPSAAPATGTADGAPADKDKKDTSPAGDSSSSTGAGSPPEGSSGVNQSSGVPVFGGLLAAAGALAIAFWMLLKGGQTTAVESR